MTDGSVAAKLFGVTGSAFKTIAEVLTHSDNVLLWRLGTTSAILAGIGADISATGFNIEFGQRQANTASIYKIWYANGALYLWLNGNLAYAFDTANGVFEDTGDSLVNGTAVAGQNLLVELGSAFIPTHAYTVGSQVKPAVHTGFNYICTAAGISGSAEPVWNAVYGGSSISGAATFKTVNPSAPAVQNALTLTQAAAVVVTAPLVAPAFTAAKDGTGLTARQTYIALSETLDLLSTQQISQVICPNVVLDAPNVAFYVASDATTLINNPATNPDALDFLQTVTDIYGDNTYTWASDAAIVFSSPADRLAQGFHEVNFGYLLARFSASQQEELGGCTAFIGTNGPGFYNGQSNNRFDLLSTRRWVGAIPTYDINGNPASFGVGLCGISYVKGTTSSKLNPLTVDFARGYRTPGFFATDTNEYDGVAILDKNGSKYDIGQYVHAVYEYSSLTNTYGSAYVGNLAALVAGKASTLDQKQALTYKSVLGAVPIWKPNFAQMEALSGAKLNGLRGDEASATLLHDNTLALSTSDWSTLYSTSLRYMASAIAFKRGKQFFGTNALNGLQATALSTALQADGAILQTRGYFSSIAFKPTTTVQDARIGAASIDVTFSIPGQLRKIFYSLGLTQTITSN